MLVHMADKTTVTAVSAAGGGKNDPGTTEHDVAAAATTTPTMGNETSVSWEEETPEGTSSSSAVSSLVSSGDKKTSYAPVEVSSENEDENPDLHLLENGNDAAGNNGGQDFYRWNPSGSSWKDMMHFVGPGWFVCIAYIDPGNYQADIQAGATTRYSLLFALWWTSILSIYVQILCVRLAYYGQVTLAEVQARDGNMSNKMRYMNWFIAEFSAVITDLPEVIGIGIACNVFFGWPYYIGVLLSLFTTMLFLALLQYGLRILEIIIAVFVGIMSISLFVEMSVVGVNTEELIEGWVYGFVHVTSSDIFAITGILGSVVMPHNLYLHTAACQSRRVNRTSETIVRKAVWYSSLEPIVPIIASFFVNMAIVAIAAERVYGQPNADQVGLTDFCTYFSKLKGGCFLWGIALLAAGQSSAITTTFTGQYIMDGFLNIQLPVSVRAIVTRLVAITPCVFISVLVPDQLNELVNFANAALSFLLPFAFTPLVKYNCSKVYMGKFASTGCERFILYTFAFLVYAVNAMAMSTPGGGFFGFVVGMEWSMTKFVYIVIEIIIQVLYAWWNWNCITTPVAEAMMPINDERPYDSQFASVLT